MKDQSIVKMQQEIQEDIVIRTRKGRIYIYAVAASVLCAGSIIMLLSGEAEYLFSKIICFMLAMASGLFLALLIPLFKGCIIIGRDGLTDCTKLNRTGPVSWNDFEDFEKFSVKVNTIKSNKFTDGTVNGTITRNYIAAMLRPQSQFAESAKIINSNILPGGGSRELADKYSCSLIICTDNLECSADSLLQMLKSRLPHTEDKK